MQELGTLSLATWYIIFINFVHYMQELRLLSLSVWYIIYKSLVRLLYQVGTLSLSTRYIFCQLDTICAGLWCIFLYQLGTFTSFIWYFLFLSLINAFVKENCINNFGILLLLILQVKWWKTIVVIHFIYRNINIKNKM